MTDYNFKDNFLHPIDSFLIKATEKEAIFKISKNYSSWKKVGELVARNSRTWDEISGVRWYSNFPVAIRMIKYGKDYSLMSLKNGFNCACIYWIK